MLNILFSPTNGIPLHTTYLHNKFIRKPVTILIADITKDLGTIPLHVYSRESNVEVPRSNDHTLQHT